MQAKIQELVNNFFYSVKEFMEAGDQPFNTNDQNILTLRKSLLLEEYNELLQAHKDNSMVELLDGIIDCLYVSTGDILTQTGSIPQIDDNDYQRYFFNAEKLNSETYIENLTNVIENFYYKYEVFNFLNLLGRLLDISKNYFGEDYLVLIDKAFKEVHASNMSKVVNGKVIKSPEGKILKPETYFKPDLKKILEEFYNNN